MKKPTRAFEFCATQQKIAGNVRIDKTNDTKKNYQEMQFILDFFLLSQ